ncbi:MAG TPA: aminotransferase class V-fold PLP-dependent enzyme [Thermomicrobiales bacterium]|nr:aminotransferase class V-fold PLP-dependent enzyme [Thermomicrobiales bacterium]
MSDAVTSASYDLAATRRALPILNEWTYLNTGTVGIMAEPVLARHLAYIADHERGGHATQSRATEGYERARRTLATLLNVAPSDIALNRNATDGINWVAARFPLRAGDEVITSTEEHPAMIYPWLAACERAGARLRFTRLSADLDQLLDGIRAVLTDRTRVVAISQVSCETGTRAPVERLREVVGPNVVILVDASQSVGQFPVDIPSLNADFVIGNGHKWLAGPKGSGFAWFDPQKIDLVPPAYFGDGAIEPHWSRAYYQTDPPPALHFAGDASRFEYGTRAWHTYEALADAIEYQAALGWDAIFAHVDTISTRMKEALNEVPGVDVVTPMEWRDSSGIVTFTIAGLSGIDASRELWESYRIVQRRVEAPSAVRVSCTYFTNDEDLTRLVEAVDRIARGR